MESYSSGQVYYESSSGLLTPLSPTPPPLSGFISIPSPCRTGAAVTLQSCDLAATYLRASVFLKYLSLTEECEVQK